MASFKQLHALYVCLAAGGPLQWQPVRCSELCLVACGCQGAFFGAIAMSSSWQSSTTRRLPMLGTLNTVAFFRSKIATLSGNLGTVMPRQARQSACGSCFTVCEQVLGDKCHSTSLTEAILTTASQALLEEVLVSGTLKEV